MEAYSDPKINVKNVNKRVDVDSDDDFMPDKYAKVGSSDKNTKEVADEQCKSSEINKVITPIFTNVKYFSEIPNFTVLQVLEIIPPKSESDLAVIHFSDSINWVRASLCQGILNHQNLFFLVL